MAAAIEIRRVTADTAALLDHVGEGVFDEEIDKTRLAAFLADPLHLLVVAVSDRTVVGQCMAMIHRHPDTATELYIDNLGVASAVHRKGVATRLMREVLAWGKELGCALAWVGTEPDNAAARALYQSLGPVEAETFAFYAFDLSGD